MDEAESAVAAAATEVRLINAGTPTVYYLEHLSDEEDLEGADEEEQKEEEQA